MAEIKVRLKLSDDNVLTSEIVDDGQEKAFNQRDAADFFEVIEKVQKESKRNTDERKQNGKIPKGRFVRADDYVGEPAYAHAGIHLDYRNDDELIFCANKKINIVVEITPDPELFRVVDNDLEPNTKLTKHELRGREHFPFNEDPKKFPNNRVIVVNGEDTPPLKLRTDGQGKQRVKEQRFYKFSATVMGSPSITLDPHIEIHDGD